MMTKLDVAVGDVWKRRDGSVVRLETVTHAAPYCLMDANGQRYAADGRTLKLDDGRGDLVQLVERTLDRSTILALLPAGPVEDHHILAIDLLTDLGWRFVDGIWTGGRKSGDVEGYEILADVLDRAYAQAATGKGKERHAQAGEPFDEQVMQDGARRFGVGALLFQAFKKSEESQRLPLEQGIRELLGAINYLAGAVIRREADAA